ncbi:DUF2165 domain-containing protein [Parachlamydia sp. AcF125]|uniref:DUF2165 domain-containing protein n=1 Tax=Parachlamydia sp. AcF125 TaxID=2795736 RepID=UPI001BCA3156|nr:DUF2165 domain-containing protein [Parachlamydia sp. AcF125]MBS4168534.1 hypothetical protein [Parachlamydia sp. AcF125]
MIKIQHLKIFVLAVIAAFFSLVTLNNIVDYETNHWCVQSTLAMESVQASNVVWRAIQSPWVITSAYILIILVEATIALLCWLSVILMLLKRGGKRLGLLSLTLAFGLFMLGFVVIAGEWFYMWQHSALADMQQKAAVFAVVMLNSMLFVAYEEP